MRIVRRPSSCRCIRARSLAARTLFEPKEVPILGETNPRFSRPYQEASDPGENSVSGVLRMKPMPMRLNVWLWLSLAAVACLAAMPAKTAAADAAPEGPTRLLRYADISKDRVVFAYAGDLWISSREGGAARRLTSHVG